MPTRLHLEAKGDGTPAMPRMPYVRLDPGSDSSAGVWGKCEPAINVPAVLASLDRAKAAGRVGAIHIGWFLHRCTFITGGYTTVDNVVCGLLSGAYPCMDELRYARPYLAPLAQRAGEIGLIWADAEHVPNLDAPQLFPGVYEAWKSATQAAGEAFDPMAYSRAGRQALINTGQIILSALGLNPDALCVWNCADVDNGWATRDGLHPPVNLHGCRAHLLATTGDDATTRRLVRNLRDTARPSRAVVHLSERLPIATLLERVRICEGFGVKDVIIYGGDATTDQLQTLYAAVAARSA